MNRPEVSRPPSDESAGLARAPSQTMATWTTTLMSFTPLGTASSGTLYLRGRDGSQYAVRVLGATGRTRVLRYEPVTRTWVEVS